MSKYIRVRFAPSPTGWLHIGGLRTALYNYLFARSNGGTFILRIEDTDQNRYVEGAEDDIINSLKWAGIDVDEGPETGGDCAPYRQSERSELYRQYAQKLVDGGHAYFAFDTPSEIEEKRASGDHTWKYDALTRMQMRNSLTLPEAETRKLIDSGAEHVIRLKVPQNESVRFHDLIRGDVSFNTSELDDQVLLKSDGLPTYHLANVVDDHEMHISHVIRGEEWLSSAPKHILLYRFLGWEPPEMAHLPLIMSPSGGKLSKRKAEEQGILINVRDYVSGRFEPAAVINYLAFLGWSPGDDREVLSMKELCGEFSLERVSKAGAVFDMQKLRWYNEQYLRSRKPKTLAGELRAVLHEAGLPDRDDAYLAGAIGLMVERVSLLPEIVEQGRFLFAAPEEYDEKTVSKAWKEDTPRLLTAYLGKIEALPDDGCSAETLKEKLTETIEEAGVGFGKLMLPLRLAVTGMGSGPDLFATMALLGKAETTSRIKAAIRGL